MREKIEREEIEWSPYQKAIFAEEPNGKEHVVVNALAGSAKSSTLIELANNHISNDLSTIVVAFNVKIANELKSKIEKAEVRTLHSFGLKMLYKHFGKDNITVDNDKVYTLIEKTLKSKVKKKETIYQLVKAVNFCRNVFSSSKEEILETCLNFEIDFGDIKEDEFVNHVSFLMNLCKKYKNIVDFSDQIWLPVVLDLKVDQYNRVLIDESQDLTKTQRLLTLKMVKPKIGKIYILGDENQVIYAWNGADPNGMLEFKKALNAKSLTLPISYRCSISVIKEAQKLVPEIQPWEKAKQGEVKSISYGEMLKLASPGCFILSRYNAPIVSIAMKLIKEKKPCNIQGKDIGQGLKGLIKSSRCKSIDSLITYLDKWKVKECAKLNKQKKSSESIVDKADALKTIAESSKSLNEMIQTIDELFYDGDDYNRIVCSSIHASKGLEREKVFLLMNTVRNHPKEEANCKYVAITRSKNFLYLVQSEKKKNKKECITDADTPRESDNIWNDED